MRIYEEILKDQAEQQARIAQLQSEIRTLDETREQSENSLRDLLDQGDTAGYLKAKEAAARCSEEIEAKKAVIATLAKPVANMEEIRSAWDEYYARMDAERGKMISEIEAVLLGEFELYKKVTNVNLTMLRAKDTLQGMMPYSSDLMYKDAGKVLKAAALCYMELMATTDRAHVLMSPCEWMYLINKAVDISPDVLQTVRSDRLA